MLFNSFQFLIFLPIVFLLYWFVFRERRWQNLLVIVASYVFYGWWDWRFLGLIVVTSLSSYASGLLIEHFEGNRTRQRLVSAANIVVNLLILGYFKYFNFFAENLDLLVQSLTGHHLDWVTTDIILPVGISFYTFQALSYTIDVYRRQIRATHDLIEFCAYISFFPQLVAGPIERATNLLPQFQRDRRFDYGQAVDGLRQMLWGLFKKLVVADNCAMAVNGMWNAYDTISGASVFLLGFMFTLQIYCDFSGYSDIAIGCARLFGFNLMRNFNFPYFSRDIPEFWRRWHISLTSWFRDYVYIPLGGNRCGRGRMMANVLIVWAISGLWHGANWTFICWGLYHALLLIIYNVLGISSKKKPVVAFGRWLPSLKELLQMVLTLILVVIGWMIFRCEDMNQAVHFISHMFTSFADGPLVVSGKRGLCAGIIVLIVEWLQRDKQHALQIDPAPGVLRYTAVRCLLYVSILVAMFFLAGQVQTFIYFQF